MQLLSTIPGFDLDSLEAFAEHAASHPDEVLLGFEAKAHWEGRSVENFAKVGPWSIAGHRTAKPSRDYSIQFGGCKEVLDALGAEGAGDRMEPVEGMLAALCACVSRTICISAAREGLSIEGLEVAAHATVDPRVLLGAAPADEAASCLQALAVEITVRGGGLDDTGLTRIGAMAARSPVYAMIAHANPLRTCVRAV